MMPGEPTIDIERLLQPIDGPSPSGRNLAYDAEYDLLREARRSDDDSPQGDWQRATKRADWDEVLRLGADCLQSKSKDLQLAAWVAEALARLYRFAGLRDGLILIHHMMDRFWDSLYPEVEAGDLEGRSAPIEFLNRDRLLPLLIRSVPLTDVLGEKRYSLLRYQESRATSNLGKRDVEAMEALIAEGKLTGEMFDEAVALTPRRFYETLIAEMVEARDACKALDQALDVHYGRDAPSLGNVRKAFDDCRRLLDPILAGKRAQEPDEPTGQADEEPSGESPDPEPGEEDHDTSRPPPSRRRRAAAGAPITSVEDAFDRVLEAATFLRQNEPANPAGYLVTRALRMGELYAQGQSPGPSCLTPPASETRQALKRLAAEGAWETLLDQAEQALGRPEGRGWLDPHRYALTAMSAAGDADRGAANVACRAWLRAILADFPELPRGELADDTPTANAETRGWIEQEITPAPAEEPPFASYLPPPLEIPAAIDGGAGEPDPWALAVEDVQNGQPAEAFARLRRALAAASCGRDRFRRKLQMAELCLLVNNLRVALPLLEELARLVDEFQLESWEDEELCARVWGALYRCLRGLGVEHNGSAERIQQAYTRLCRLDINQALSYGE